MSCFAGRIILQNNSENIAPIYWRNQAVEYAEQNVFPPKFDEIRSINDEIEGARHLFHIYLRSECCVKRDVANITKYLGSDAVTEGICHILLSLSLPHAVTEVFLG